MAVQSPRNNASAAASRSSDQSIGQVATDGCDHRTDEGEVPEVPDIDVEGLGPAQEEHYHVDQDRDRDDPQANLGTEGDCRGRGPTDIHYIAGNAQVLHQRLTDIRQGTPHQTNDQVDADEGDADDHASTKCFSGFCTQDQRDEKDNNGQCDRGAKTIDHML